MTHPVDGHTIVLATLANPNKGSLAPGMHNAGFEAVGLNAVYVGFEPDVHDLASALLGMRALGLRGVSISKPFKVEAMSLVDEVDPIARRIGAVNIIVNDDGKLTGYNSDWQGSTRALEQVTNLAGRRVTVLGAGGAAQGVVFGLVEAGAEVVVYNRSVERGEALADTFGVTFGGNIEAASANSTGVEILVNATSLGRTPEEELDIPLDAFPQLEVVLDVSFVRPTTRFLNTALARGIEAVHGIDMLVEQGAVAFELFTGVKAPLSAMRSYLSSEISDPS